MNAVLSDLTPQPRGLNKSVVLIMEFLVEKIFTYFRNHYLSLCFLSYPPTLLLWHLLPMQPGSHQTNHFSLLAKPLADSSGRIAEAEDVQSSSQGRRGAVLEEVMERM